MPARLKRPQRLEFESLAFAVESRDPAGARAAARRALRAAFSAERWQIVPLAATRNEFLARPRSPGGRRRSLSDRAAWDRAYRLRDQPQVVYAEPLFTILDEAQHRPKAGVRRTRSSGSGIDPRTDNKYEWPLHTMRVRQAWALFDRRTPGAGVLVGHPDTGYTRHPEIFGPRLRANLGFDFVDGGDPTDPLANWPLMNPGHGTGTSSVIMSGEGQPDGWEDPEFVSGIAPGASLAPIRTTKSVILLSMENLIKAIHHAIAANCHVVSISLGGPVKSTALHNAVKAAENAGVIVLCAAGNTVRFVVFPAAFDEVIAVAASDIGDEPWTGSCRGDAVDITAPGHSVYRAEVSRKQGNETYEVARGSGTSFSVAAVAGVAGLWLSYHGRSLLVRKYGKDRLAAVFKTVLLDTCRTPSGWEQDEFGRGIVHAARLLSAELPREAPARGMRGLRRRPVSEENVPLETIVHLLTPAPRSGVERAIAALLQVSERQLPEILEQIGDELAFRIGVDGVLRQRLIDAASSRRSARAGGAARPPRSVLTARRALLHSSSRRLRNTLRAR